MSAERDFACVLLAWSLLIVVGVVLAALCVVSAGAIVRAAGEFSHEPRIVRSEIDMWRSDPGEDGTIELGVFGSAVAAIASDGSVTFMCDGFVTDGGGRVAFVGSGSTWRRSR